MLSHALTIVVNELNKHLSESYSVTSDSVALGNIAEGFGTNAGDLARGNIYLSIVNIKEDKALKNVPHYVRNDIKLTASFGNPPVFLNFQILVVVTHKKYADALLGLSRIIQFFQFKNTFTQDNVAPGSISTGSPPNPLDQLESFKLIFDLSSPTMEEVNHLWGTLGGKQYPFVLYSLRMLDLKFKAMQSESGLITEVVSDFYHKNGVAN